MQDDPGVDDVKALLHAWGAGGFDLDATFETAKPATQRFLEVSALDVSSLQRDGGHAPTAKFEPGHVTSGAATHL
jgi:hypothetical protein